MFRTIRICLFTFFLILLVPIYPSDAQIIENKSGYNRQILYSDKTNINSGNPSSFIGSSTVYADPELPSWILYENPVLTKSPTASWDDVDVATPSVVFDGTKYHMWYAGLGTNTEGGFKIGYATSNNGLSWDKHPENPVLTFGEPGSWEDFRVLMPTVLYNGSNWEMWYAAQRKGSASYNIGYASSEDGINWTKYSGNPVLIPGLPSTWDWGGIREPFVLLEFGIYNMWYSNVEEIGYAESTDGVHWMKYPNPVIPVHDNREDCLPRTFTSPTVIHSGDYYLWASYFQNCSNRWYYGGVVQSFSADKVTWSTPEVVNPFTVSNSSSVIYRYGGLLKQMWFSQSGRIYYAEDSQLLKAYLPLLTR